VVKAKANKGCCPQGIFLFILSLVLVGALCYWSFYHWDQKIAFFFHEAQTLRLTLTQSTFLSELFEAPLMVVVLILTGLLYLNLKQNAPDQTHYCNASAIAFLAVLFAAILTGIIKVIVGRYRPEMLFTQQSYGFTGFELKKDLLHSMPSGHTSRAFSILLGLTAFSRGKAWPYIAIILASMVGCARLILTQHYLSDVILGAYVGMISFVLAKMWVNCCFAKSSC
jgi:membrane-associated phospholipid phosphatase